MQDHYIPLIVAALTVLLLGHLNFVRLQSMQNGKPSGHPSALWLALAALGAGMATCYFIHDTKTGRKLSKELMSGEFL
jgi:hypothetical protein